MPLRTYPTGGMGYLGGYDVAEALAPDPDPDPIGWQGFTSASEAAGVFLQGGNFTTYEAWLGRPVAMRLAFTTGTGGNECTRAQMLSDFTGHMNTSGNFVAGRIFVESTQLVFEDGAQTLQQAAETTANDTVWQDMGAAVAAKNRDVRLADGSPQLAMRIGWEMNGSWYPWATGRTSGSGWASGNTRAQRSAWYAQAFDRAKANMAIGGADVDQMEWVVNFANGWGSATDNRTAIPTGATCISADFYDTSSLYSSNPTNKAGQRAAVWSSKVSSAGGLNFCRTEALARGLKFCADEWGLSNWGNGTGGDDNPDFIQNTFDYFNSAATSGNMGWLGYFEFDTSDGGFDNNHRLHNGDYAFTTAEAKYLDLFGA